MAGRANMEKLAVELETSVSEVVRKLKVIARHAEALALELGADVSEEAGAAESPPPEDDPPSRP